MRHHLSSSSGRLPSPLEYLSPQGVLLPPVYGTTASPMWLELQGPAAWQRTPSWTVCPPACHQSFPWLRVTFAMAPDAAYPGSDQRPWSTASATGPVDWLRRSSASHPWGVVHYTLSLCRPRSVRASGVQGPFFTNVRLVCVLCTVFMATCRLFTGVRAVCGTRVVLVASFDSPPFSFFFFFLFECCLFLAFCFVFLKREEKEKPKPEHYRHRHGQSEQRLSSAVFLFVVCVAGVFPVVAPQGCGWRVIMYTVVG